MSHEFKPADAYACGMLTMLLSRVEEHESEHAGMKPRCIVLHAASYEALQREMVERFGGVESAMFPTGPNGEMMRHMSCRATLIGLCPENRDECFDRVIDVFGNEYPL